MPESLMLDSGAFTVWSRGGEIDIDRYISFCKEHSEIAYYVNLDVIPGKPADRRSFTPMSVDKACQVGWDNYKRMIGKLPKEKVIPVFHNGDSALWLRRYLDDGSEYVGIAPGQNRSTESKLQWLEEVVQPIVRETGVKMHGFAVTSFKLMKFWEWESVDSSSWVRMGGMGVLFIPRLRGGSWDYSLDPYMVSFTERPPHPSHSDGFFSDSEMDGDCVNAGGSHPHVLTLPPTIRATVDRYLAENGVELGEWQVRAVVSGYKKKRGEVWADKDHTRVVECTKKGVITCNYRRKWLNMLFFQRAEQALPVRRMYLSGMGTCKRIERDMQHRLLSYYDIEHTSEARRILELYN